VLGQHLSQWSVQDGGDGAVIDVEQGRDPPRRIGLVDGVLDQVDDLMRTVEGPPYHVCRVDWVDWVDWVYGVCAGSRAGLRLVAVLLPVVVHVICNESLPGQSPLMRHLAWRMAPKAGVGPAADAGRAVAQVVTSDHADPVVAMVLGMNHPQLVMRRPLEACLLYDTPARSSPLLPTGRTCLTNRCSWLPAVLLLTRRGGGRGKFGAAVAADVDGLGVRVDVEAGRRAAAPRLDWAYVVGRGLSGRGAV
jgi:hypothetical protein